MSLTHPQIPKIPKMSPTILLVPGAWCPPIFFDPLRESLNSKGITSVAVALPSVGAVPATTTLDDDIAHLRTELLALVDAGTEVILAAHSYGGVVASGAAEGLTRNERQIQGKEGGVVLIVYMAAWVAPKGANLKQMLGGEFPPCFKVEGDRLYCIDVDNILFHDLSPAEQARWASLLTHTALEVFSGTATFEPWHTISTTFIITEDDHALPPPVQEQMAQLLGTDLVYRVKSSHSLILSLPDRVAEILEELIGKVAPSK